MFTKVEISGLTNDESDKLNLLLKQRDNKLARNLLRERYYDAEQVVKQLGIAVPSSMASLTAVLEWPAKTVNILNRRLHLDGFVVPGQTNTDGPFEVNSILDANSFGIEAKQAHVSSMKFGPSFVAVVAGDVRSGEPEVLFTPRSALHMTALWDYRRRQISAALSIIDEDEQGPKEIILYLPDTIMTAQRVTGGWRADFRGHDLGRVPVSILPFQPDLDKPFGRSRITRSVMDLTDQAARTLLRTEVSAEFYSSPQRYMIGAAESAFRNEDGSLKTGWEITLGKMLVLDAAEAGEDVKVGQFAAASMEPHAAQLRMIATAFAGVTDIPVGALGVIHDNPSSAEAMEVGNLELVLTAEDQQPVYGRGWLDAVRMALQIRDGLDSPTAEMFKMRAKWRNAATPSKAQATQAVIGQVTAGILPPDSAVTLEELGYDQTDIERIQADQRRAQAGNRVAELVAAARGVRAAVDAPEVPAVPGQAPVPSPAPATP